MTSEDDEPIELTADEKRAIAALKRAAKIWPKSLWVFAGDGVSITILKCGEDGERVFATTGGIDASRVVDRVYIPNDGGDW